jgi:serine/threonine protein kinase
MCTINDYKIIKKIGFGGQGTVYLVKYENKFYALKIEKILDKYIKKSLYSPIWREIEFANKMNKLHPLGFMKLYEHDIIDNCDFTLDNPHNIERINELNKSSFCSRKIYEYVETQLLKIIDKLNINEIYSIIIQFCYNIYIMNKNGYTHNDLHPNNIGINKTKIKYISIFGYNIPTFNNIVKIIDYGTIMHKKYKLHKSELFVKHESKLLTKKNINSEIRNILNIVASIEFYGTLSKDFWNKNYLLFINFDKQFFNSTNLLLVDKLVKHQNNKLLLFKMIYPEKYQKLILGKKFKKVIDNILRIPIEDYIYLLNATHIKNVNDIKHIILYFIIKLCS